MNILSKKLAFKNFKGIKELTINFGKVTSIYGINATGKTTIDDGEKWLLFGKDSKDRKDFEIKTLDSSGEAIHGLEHSVEGVFEVDGKEITLKRVYEEKWTKKKGLADKVFSGHETTYYIDGVPAKQKEYNEKVENILADKTFKLISNPLYFNSLEWKKQREIVLELVGDVDAENVINYKDSLKPLIALLNDDNVDDLRKKVKAKISQYNKDKTSIPARIDENNNSIVEADWDGLEFEKRTIQGSINSIDEQIADSSKVNEGKIILQNKLFELKNKLQEGLSRAKADSDRPLQALRSKINDIKYKLQNLAFNIKTEERKKEQSVGGMKLLQENIKAKQAEQEELREQWTKENNSVFEFDDTATLCPTCMREYEADKIAEIKTTAEGFFDEMKAKKLASISMRGQSFSKVIEGMENTMKSSEVEIEKYANTIIELTTEKESLDKKLILLEEQVNNFQSSEIIFDGQENLKVQIESIQSELQAFQSADNSSLIEKKKELQGQLEAINKRLTKKDNNETLRTRNKELQDQERDITNKIAELEGQDFLCEAFIRTKVELLDERINSKFKTIRFKLFNAQVNGGLEETCKCLIDGVPFSDANTASRINAGMEIINTLCEHYGVNAPIFIDNSEGVNKILDTDSQIIKLFVLDLEPVINKSDKAIVLKGQSFEPGETIISREQKIRAFEETHPNAIKNNDLYVEVIE